MNMHRPHSRRGRAMAAALLGALVATSLAQAEPAGTPAGATQAPADATPASPSANPAPANATPAPPNPNPAPADTTPPPSNATPAPADAAAPAPAAAVTATAKAPATLVIDRQGAGNDAFLDLNVRAFKPPRRGAVEAVVTLEENKDGGREVNVGTFAIFPAKKFEAKKPDDERGFRLDATQALADLGADHPAVKIKVRLAPLHEGQSATGAKLTLGKVQFVPRDEPKDPK